MAEKIFLNHTNHPSAKWDEPQLTAAAAYGKVKDLPFPAIDPLASCQEVRDMAAATLAEIARLDPVAVLCQGEFTYTYALVEGLKRLGILALSATSERIVAEAKQPGGASQKVSLFRFVCFRPY